MSKSCFLCHGKHSHWPGRSQSSKEQYERLLNGLDKVLRTLLRSSVSKKERRDNFPMASLFWTKTVLKVEFIYLTCKDRVTAINMKRLDYALKDNVFITSSNRHHIFFYEFIRLVTVQIIYCLDYLFPGKTRWGCAKLHNSIIFSSCTIRFFWKKMRIRCSLIRKLIYVIVLLHQASIILIYSSYLMILLMPFHRFLLLNNNRCS